MLVWTFLISCRVCGWGKTCGGGCDTIFLSLWFVSWTTPYKLAKCALLDLHTLARQPTPFKQEQTTWPVSKSGHLDDTAYVIVKFMPDILLLTVTRKYVLDVFYLFIALNTQRKEWHIVLKCTAYSSTWSRAEFGSLVKQWLWYAGCFPWSAPFRWSFFSSDCGTKTSRLICTTSTA